MRTTLSIKSGLKIPSFLRDVIKLVSGTALGRAITLASLPVVTRLYHPEEFALLSVYLSAVSLLSVVACLRLDVAIPLADGDQDAINLLALSGLVLFLTVSFVLAAIIVMPEAITQWVGKPEIFPYLWLVPAGVWISGSYAALQLWATRTHRFSAIAHTRVSQAFAGAATTLSLGWAGLGPIGLMIGNVMNLGAGGLSLFVGVLRYDRAVISEITPSRMRSALRKYYRYPMYSTPEALMNISGIHVPTLLIAAYQGSEAGFLLLAMQVMSTPMALLGNSISQVYVSRAPKEFCEGRLQVFTMSIMRRLALIVIGPLIFAGMLAPVAFEWVFGADWSRAGEIVKWLVPWIALQFIASPVSMVMFVVGRQRTMLALTSFGACLRIGSVIYAYFFEISAVSMFAMSSAIFYGVCCATFLYAAQTTRVEVRQN